MRSSVGKGASYKADLIDPWEMTIAPIPGAFKEKFSLNLPGKPYQAVLFKAIAQEFPLEQRPANR